ncbi:hypothetical protein [Vibrio navarrensis]|uniref:Capsular biosynthesis protein n=1 Tax=Vibrio navarrensis TaxID=29495 RepID=A0AAJ4IBJ0_9VIBR|nr:hypothetical protein I3X05_01145 [Vibrio navarrensis]
MTKLLLVCPANTSQMPYLKNYIEVLISNGIQYDVLCWDRLSEEREGPLVYKDGKIGHQRGFYDYFNYSIYVRRLIKKHGFTKLIVFGIPLAFFLSRFLVKNYRDMFVIDIRDHHRLLCIFYNFGNLLSNSALSVISSGGFLKWLPNNISYIINHNTSKTELPPLRVKSDPIFNRNTISISCIGSLKDIAINRELLTQAAKKSLSYLRFNFHGDGVINDELTNLAVKHPNLNINVTGRYYPSEERELYLKSDFINMFMSPDSINNNTCMSNRLYNSVLYGVPLLVLEGSYLSDIVLKYNLGMVFCSLDDFFDDFFSRISSFDLSLYEKGRYEFFKLVLDENACFRKSILKFVGCS